MSKPQIFADTLPPILRRACGCMSGDGGFRAWLDAKFGAGKWVHGEYLPEGFERNITNRELGDLAVEYGYGRLQAVFSNAPELPLHDRG
jgi:hypothetical protein